MADEAEWRNGKSVEGERDESETVTNPLPVPPRLMRREKTRNANGDVIIESRKSRLSCRLKENNACSVTMVPKPLDTFPPQDPDLVGHCSTVDIDQTVDIICGLPCATQPSKSRDVLTSGSSTSDFGRTSTEPSTAESTDSGIQPSLCSTGSNDEKGHSSGPDDDDLITTSQPNGRHSDYLLFEEARAMALHCASGNLQSNILRAPDGFQASSRRHRMV